MKVRRCQKVLVLTAYLILTFYYIGQYFREWKKINHEISILRSGLELTGYENFEKLFPIKTILKYKNELNQMPHIYVITPTISMDNSHLADMVRLRNTFWLVPKLTWIVVEDSIRKSIKLTSFLKNSNISYIHLTAPTDKKAKPPNGKKSMTRHRGIEQRNAGLKWLRDNKDRIDVNSVVYFADDDNTYDIRLFDEMRHTKIASVWPVAIVGGCYYEKPICIGNKVVSWFFFYNRRRLFPIDMAAFAVNLQLLLKKNEVNFQTHSYGELESQFLSSLVNQNDLEGRTENCSKVYVWHTRTKKYTFKQKKNPRMISNEYENNLLKQI